MRVEGVELAGKRLRMGVQNSSSVLAAASIDVSQSTSLKCDVVIQSIRAQM